METNKLLRVSEDTRKKLFQLKLDKDLKSIEEVIKYLLDKN